VFFQRVEWVPAAGPDTDAAAEFTAFAASLGMQARLVSTARRQRVVLFVSKADHCFHDLILRWRAGDLPGDLVAVVGNHPDLAAAAAGYGLPFHHVPVTPEGKLTFADGISAPGRYVEMRAERDVIALISNCPQLNNPCNAYNPTPVEVFIWE
jgi:formyltetrahydrofolate hydrolase